MEICALVGFAVADMFKYCDPTKTAQYFNISTTANPAKTKISKTVLKRCKTSKFYSSELMIIEEKNPIINTLKTLNRKRTVLINFNVFSVLLQICFKLCSVNILTIYNH